MMWANLMLLFGIVGVATALECYPGVCRIVRCMNRPCGEHEILIKNGGMCGCCDICISKLEDFATGNILSNLH